MEIRLLQQSDIKKIVEAFKVSNWTVKKYSLFEQYLNEQNQSQRVCWTAYQNEEFAGYVTLKWKSSYPHFSKREIPEIVDLNVLPLFRNKGVATALLDIAEALVSSKTNTIGIGVGLYKEYGSAQRLYIKRGYLPDGQGVTYNYQPTTPGKSYCLDDDFILWFTKKLNA